MTQKLLWRVVLIAVLCVALAAPARATSLETDGKLIVVGIVVVSGAVAVLVTLLILHHGPKRSAVTGCVVSGANGLSLTDEKDKRTYALSGDTTGVKPGERMTLKGEPKDAGRTLVFVIQRVTRDFGACQP